MKTVAVRPAFLFAGMMERGRWDKFHISPFGVPCDGLVEPFGSDYGAIWVVRGHQRELEEGCVPSI